MVLGGRRRDDRWRERFLGPGFSQSTYYAWLRGLRLIFYRLIWRVGLGEGIGPRLIPQDEMPKIK